MKTLKTSVFVVRASVLNEALKDAEFSKVWFKKETTFQEREKLLREWMSKHGLEVKDLMI